MTNKFQENLRTLIESLQREGIEFPKYKFINNPENFEVFYKAKLEKSSRWLDLDTTLEHVFYIPGVLDSREVLNSGKGIRTYDLVFCFYDIYGGEYGGYPIEDFEPEEIEDNVKSFKEDSDLIDRLDNHLSKIEVIDVGGRDLAFTHDKTYGGFYSELVRGRKLRWADILGEQFPYVVTDSSVLGTVGRSEGGLYFVAVDIAREPWQEQAVALHERYHQEKGHEYSVKREQEFVRSIGKEKEYKAWREQINIDAKNGKYFL